MATFQIQLLAGAVDKALELMVRDPLEGRQTRCGFTRDLYYSEIGEVIEEVLALGSCLLALGLLEHEDLSSGAMLDEFGVEAGFLVLLLHLVGLQRGRCGVAGYLEIEELIVSSGDLRTI